MGPRMSMDQDLRDCQRLMRGAQNHFLLRLAFYQDQCAIRRWLFMPFAGLPTMPLI